METIDQPPANTETLPGWIQNLPTNFTDVNEGVIQDMISLTLRYFKEVKKAAGPYQDAPSVLEVLDLQKRFRLWANGVSGLDRKLENDLKVRESIVSELAALVLNLSTGITLFTHECQQILFDKTNRVLEQASKIAPSHLKHPASCLPSDILGFCNSKTEIKSRIDNLYHLLPTIQHLVENFDETEPRQAEEIGVEEGWSFSDSHINRPRSTITSASKSSSTSPGAKDSRKHNSNASKSSTKKSYRSTDPSSISTIFPDSGTYDSANPLTDTVTSDSLSDVEQSSSKPITPISTAAPSICKKCRTTFSDPAGMENQIAFNSDEPVRIWHRNGQESKESRILLIDSGADESFIHRSIVEELELETTQSAPTTLTAFNGHVFTVSERVQPKWQFHKESGRHQKFAFFVVDNIPGNRDMVLGNIAMGCLGIGYWASGALVAHEDYEDHSTLAWQQQLHAGQLRDMNASEAKKRQEIVARRARLGRERAAADAATKKKQSNPASQDDATSSGNNQG